LRVQQLVDALPHNTGRDAFPSSLGLDPREDLIRITGRSAQYSDIDFYGHANNARYIQWIQDVTNMDILTKASQIRLDINYLSEVMPGETVELWAATIKDTVPEGTGAEIQKRDYPSTPGPSFAYEGKRPDSGQAVFRAELRTGE
jgi:hypothetical protein